MFFENFFLYRIYKKSKILIVTKKGIENLNTGEKFNQNNKNIKQKK